ncbi:porin family protein [Vibrio sp. S11_S32]|uniref:porin family protein n=1 Tax=Vibrio sp. S11_S32 TaxID=2720225 RepID=UPI00168044FD|nr:porin family protein [Vibrio sp. S11_S32]MBD1577842.1 porin family protein [Vibrio sp. S11_S32]
MLKKTLIGIAALASLAATTNCFASDKYHPQDQYDWQYEMPAYVGVNYSILNAALDSSENANLNAVELTLGYQASDYFGAEFRLSGGVEDDNLQTNSSNYERVSLDHTVGAYARAQFPFVLTNWLTITPYALAGVTSMTINASSNDFDESGFSYGAGLTVSLTKNVTVDGGYISYVDTGNVKMDGGQIGITYHF